MNQPKRVKIVGDHPNAGQVRFTQQEQGSWVETIYSLPLKNESGEIVDRIYCNEWAPKTNCETVE